jgi:DNA polymerase-1
MEDDTIGKPLSAGDMGSLLWNMVEKAGIQKKDVYRTNLLKCSTFGEKPKLSQWKECRKHFIDELQRIRPKAIVSFGRYAFEWLTGFKGVTKFRNMGLPCVFDDSILVFPFIQPASFKHLKDRKEMDRAKSQMIKDFRRLKEKARNNTLHVGDDIPQDYKMARTVEDVRNFLDEFPPGTEVAVDFETADQNWNGSLWPLLVDQGHRVVAAGFSNKPGMARTIPVKARGLFSFFYWSEEDEKEVMAMLTDFFKTRRCYGHNFVQFDAKWVKTFFGIKEELDVPFEGMYVAHLLNEEPGNHGLEVLATRYGKMVPWKGTFTVEDIDRCCKYLARDVDATVRIRKPLEDALTPPLRWLHFNLQLPAGKLFKRIEEYGVRVDLAALENLRMFIVVERKRRMDAILALEEVKTFEIRNKKDFNPNSTPHIREVMRDILKLPMHKKTGSGEYSTDKEVLAYYEDQADFCAKLLHLRRLNSFDRFHNSIKEAVDRYGEYIHTNYKVHGTVTGRPSSSEPNLSVMPRGDTADRAGVPPELIKGLFIASEGRVLMQADWSQAELRILGIISNCKMLKDLYAKGLDGHTATAAKMFNLSLEEAKKKEYRSKAKAINFGIPYGMSETSIVAGFVNNQKEAALRDGLPFDETAAMKDACNFIMAHKKQFPEVWNWMEKQKAFAKKHHYVETKLGRRRRFRWVDSRAERQALNFPIQSLQSDLLLLVMVKLDKVLRKLGFDCPIVLTVYDSIVLDVKKSQVRQVAKVVRHVMEKLDFDWLTIPMVADIEIGDNLSALKDIEEYFAE